MHGKDLVAVEVERMLWERSPLLLVWRLVFDGYSHKDAARVLGCSVSHSEKERVKLYERLRIHCAGDCARLALLHGVAGMLTGYEIPQVELLGRDYQE